MTTANPNSANPRYFTVSTAGHVDHGKTSLLRILTGIDPDRLKEEKERQMTTDLGFAYLNCGSNLVVGFVDVPGHGKFLKNMLAGVGGIDIALLVVAADEGPMPQTEQHLRILGLLGTDKVVVALTKIDAVTDPSHVSAVKERISKLLKDHDVELLDLVAVSSTKNIGIDELKQSLEKHLSALPLRDTNEVCVLPIDRVFSKSGFGTVVTGTLVKGKMKVGDQVIVAPNVTTARVRRLETSGLSVEEATAGQRVACNLVLKDTSALVRGHMLIGQEIAATDMLIVTLVDKPKTGKGSLALRLQEQPIRLYHGTAELHGYVRWAQEMKSESGASACVIALVGLNAPAVVQPQDRFVIRLTDETIYGGEIVMCDKPRFMNRADVELVSRYLITRDVPSALTAFIERAPHGLVQESHLSIMLANGLLRRHLDQLLNESNLVKLANFLMLPDTRSNLSSNIMGAVEKALEASKESDALDQEASLERVRTFMNPKLERPAFLQLIDEEVQAGHLERAGGKLDIPGRKGRIAAVPPSPELRAKIVELLEKHFCLELAEVAAICGSELRKIKAAVQMLANDGQAQVVSQEYVISDANFRRARQTLADLFKAKGDIAPGDFREALGTTRKYALPLLQHFDDNKITRRVNNGRVLLKPLD